MEKKRKKAKDMIEGSAVQSWIKESPAEDGGIT